MSLATTPSAVTKVVRNVHTTLSLLTLLLSYPQHWRKQDTSTQTPNWTSKRTYTSDLTPPHNRSTYRSTQTPPPFTAAPITIGTDITITGTTPPPPPKCQTSEDIIQTNTANADHHLQMHERRKLGRTTKPATATTPPVHGDKVIGKLYTKNMVLIPITIDPFARLGPMSMFQSFLTSTESRPQ
jgi:hypothetical protein